MKEIRHLRSDYSTGDDQIPVKFVKLVSEHIAGPLTHIINACIYLFDVSSNVENCSGFILRFKHYIS